MQKNEEKQLSLVYFKIARKLSGIKEHKLAQKVCDRGLTRFPDNANLYSLRGGILVKLFNSTKDQEYLSQAVLSYEKSLSLNPDNYLSAFTSAKIYVKRAAFQKAKEKLNLILSNSPGDPKATDLLNFINEKEKNIKQAQDEKSEESLLEPVEEMDDHSAKVGANYDLVISNLHLFGGIDGLEMVLLVDLYGVVLKCDNHSGLDADRIGIAMSNIFRSSQNAIHFSGLGTFRQGAMVSPTGYIYIVSANKAILVIAAKQKADHDVIESKIKLYLNEISP